jgi:co-chaperonin GroES (HSP10)
MLRPLRDLLVLRPLTQPGRLGLLWVPDLELSGNKNSAVCEVLAVGPGVQDRHTRGPKTGKPFGPIVPCSCKPGDKVRVDAYGSHFAGDEVEHEGEKLVVIRERDIIGILV